MASKFSIRDAIAAGSVPELGTKQEQIEYIDIDLLMSDERNFYELSGIEELAASIELIGLQQPIRVRMKGDAYVIVSGHRRKAALRHLVLDGREDFRLVPCIVETGQVSEAMQELRLIYANSDTRKLSNADLAKQAERIKFLLYQLKEEGVEFPGRMRDHVAEACQISKSKLARLEVIQKGLHPLFRKPWEAGELKEVVAYALAQMPEDQQHKVFCMQNDKSGKFVYFYESDVKRAKEQLDSIAALTCSKQGGGPCTNKEGKWAFLRTKDYYYGGCHNKCCSKCPDLAKCKYACPLLHDKVQKLKADAKLQKQQELDAKAEKERPDIELITRLWCRAGEARVSAHKSVEAVYKAVKMMWSKSDDAKHLAMELGTAKISPESSLPYGYSIRLHEVKSLVALADLFNCSLDYLLCRTDDPKRPEADEWSTWACGAHVLPAESGFYLCLTGPMKGGGKLFWWNNDLSRWEHPGTCIEMTPSVQAWVKAPEIPESLSWNRKNN